MDHDIFMHHVRDAGYDGIEIIFPREEGAKQQIAKTAQKLDLQLISHWGGVIQGDFEESIAIYEAHLRNACSVPSLFVNIQTGKDYYTFEQNLQFLALAKEISSRTGVTVLHETHRGKFSFAAHIARNFLDNNPDLRITADFSHWCCVAESLLKDQNENVALAITRTDHIHARIGFSEGHQIPDPRVLEWQFVFGCSFGMVGSNYCY